MATGYRWNPSSATDKVHITFEVGESDITFDEAYLQDLAVETYAMQLCKGQSVTIVMPG